MTWPESLWFNLVFIAVSWVVIVFVIGPAFGRWLRRRWP